MNERFNFSKCVIDHRLNSTKRFGYDIDSMPEREKAFIKKMINYMNEINDSRRSLEISTILINLKPKKTKKIDKQEYLQYHINNYLQEVYILKLRIDDLLKYIERIYKRTKIADATNKLYKVMTEYINNSFSGIIKARGGHVHVKRFTDEFINKMVYFKIGATVDVELEHSADLGYYITKNNWKNTCRNNNKAIDDIIDTVFENVNKIIIEKDTLIIPSSIIDHERNRK